MYHHKTKEQMQNETQIQSERRTYDQDLFTKRYTYDTGTNQGLKALVKNVMWKMYHDTVSDKQRILHGDNIMWSMTYSQTQTWRQSYVVNVPRHSSRQANNCTWRQYYGVHDIFKDKNMEAKLHGDNIMWSMTYTKTKTWRQS